MCNQLFNLQFLEDNRVDIWQTLLTRSTLELAELNSLLSEEERSRANKFKLEIHKNRFIIARGILRQILSLYANIQPEKIEFSYSDRGKPKLVNNIFNLQFNISHAEDIAVYGITKDRKIGIDIEYVNDRHDCLNIARRFFSASEFEAIEKVAEPDRSRLFFQLWTAKEAYLKATGEGLSGRLDRVEINTDKGRSIYVLDGKNNYRWQLQQFEPAENYLATVAVEIIDDNFLVRERNKYDELKYSQLIRDVDLYYSLILSSNS